MPYNIIYHTISSTNHPHTHVSRIDSISWPNVILWRWIVGIWLIWYWTTTAEWIRVIAMFQIDFVILQAKKRAKSIWILFTTATVKYYYIVSQILRVILLLVVLQSKYMAWNNNSMCTNIPKRPPGNNQLVSPRYGNLSHRVCLAPIVTYSQQVCNMGPYCPLVIALHLRTFSFLIVHVNFLTTIKECYCVIASSGRVQLKWVSGRRWKWSLSLINFRGRNWNANSELGSTGTGLMFETSLIFHI